MANQKRKTLVENKKNKENLSDVYGVALFALSAILMISLFAGDRGLIGKYVVEGLKYSVGMGRYIIPVFLTVWGFSFFAKKNIKVNVESTGLGLAISFISTISLIHLNTPPSQEFSFEYIVSCGGYVGATFTYVLRFLLGNIGAYIVLIALLVIGIVIFTGISILQQLSFLVKSVKALFSLKFKTKNKVFFDDRQADLDFSEEKKLNFYEQLSLNNKETQAKTRISSEEANNFASQKTTEIKIETPKIEIGKYQLPSPALLKRTISKGPQLKKDVKENVRILERTLSNFGVDASIDKVVKGPTVTLYEIHLASGVKVNRIFSLADDIALALASPDIRILAPIPGKSAVGIEVPNKQRELVTLGDILVSNEAQSDEILKICLGKDISGNSVVADLGGMPHLLIAGATGSGKSVCVNCILISLLARARPDQVKMILIDPKRIELNLYNGIPHLITPVISNVKEASHALVWAVKEMENRLGLLAEQGTRNIDSYNAQLKNKDDHMPYIVIVIDELADLMMVAPGKVEDSICRLAQLARAVGIHLVIATQRPSVDVITGLIKANITSRIAFSVSSQVDSRVIIDGAGADKLVGKGDMLFMTSQSNKLVRLQGAFITEQEVELVTNFIKKQSQPAYQKEVLESKKPKFSLGDYEDDLFDDAMELVVLVGMASVSMLQRRLRIGYTRAARLIDILEERGIIGSSEGSKPRIVLLTKEDLEKMKKK
ncbi:DNA translocase FtsK 4TM domain-containing protein [Candidatus Oleimmundimicrobium sp.]|uniref:FtsK/SpoIIIE family DNA translocase n=1 Tax=Candidatus Oleimmundimicrobium sp. TaxID=3060597 RepID=UPI00271FA2D5|nr:DNA translocase FtsK 4TM domain-containing protein [Candidatus Oleimmundimicrobium sp.]MDO8885436.1 DNA translocase FtsK 4TM domain-containing protein [Candidatus Oleimmundimicrobium sp.]